MGTGLTRVELKAYSLGDEVGVISMGSIPIASVENAYRVFGDDGKRLEEANEAALVIELQFWLAMAESVASVREHNHYL